MLSFHNDEKIKQKYIDRLKWHMEQDDIVQGIGFKNGRGCAVGCTLENYNHASYEKELGLPEWLAYLEDSIHEGLPLKEAKKWPLAFLEAIPVGVDTNLIKNEFLIRLLKRSLENVKNLESIKQPNLHTILNSVISAIEKVIDALQKRGDIYAAWAGAREAGAAATDAYITADDAYAEAASAAATDAAHAAYAADYSAAASAASAARAAAYSAAASAANAARAAAANTAAYAANAYSRARGYSSARRDEYIHQSKDLLMLLNNL